jgi:7,8-dihydropterin-6-yl-methyl-4-(beta-D-ribofuranosyl)aminobenzene 5'-phosphate synthase
VAPGHCTGEPAFTALMQAFGDHYLYAGLGSVVALGPKPHSLAGRGSSDRALAGRDAQQLLSAPSTPKTVGAPNG